MRLASQKKKPNSKLRVLVIGVICFILFLFAFNYRQQLQRSMLYVNGGSIYNDYLDTSFKLNEFLQPENGSKRKNLIVTTGSSNYVRIQKERTEKTKAFIRSGLMIRTKSEYYSADVKLGKQKSKAKVSLFGGASDNFRDSNGFHFRLKLDGGEGFGKKMYNVLKPRSRGYNVDMLANTAYQNLFDGIGIDLEPVNVIFNKSSFGIYVMEEYFDKYLMESKSFRESIIFKTMRKDSIKFKHLPDNDNAEIAKNILSDVLEDTDGSQFAALIDDEKMFGYLALIFIFNDYHPTLPDNLHFFYNSVTNKLEPLVRELNLIGYQNTPEEFGELLGQIRDNHFVIDDWIRFIGESRFDTGIKAAMFKIKTESLDLFNFPKYLDYKNKLIGFKSKMEGNEELFLKNLDKLNFLTNQEDTRAAVNEITINKDTILSEDLVIQKNEKLIINEGVTLTFENNSSLFVYGGLDIKGTAKSFVTMYAEEDSVSSIYIHSEVDILIQYTTFKNLSALDRKLWQLPSAITAYESNIIFNHCNFKSNRAGDDMLNLFRCKNAVVKNCTFFEILSDAIDTDFSNVQIESCRFESIGNDAIDGSGSKVAIVNCSFLNIEDKAISAGEESYFETSNNKIENSELGLVCKDGSTLISNKDFLLNNNIDLVVFMKKKFFKQPVVHLKETEIQSNLIEKKVIVTGLNIPKNVAKRVKDKLYGNEFGKSSK